jgi:hypothetical protein
MLRYMVKNGIKTLYNFNKAIQFPTNLIKHSRGSLSAK